MIDRYEVINSLKKAMDMKLELMMNGDHTSYAHFFLEASVKINAQRLADSYPHAVFIEAAADRSTRA